MRSGWPTIAWVTRVGRGGAVACSSKATTTVSAGMGCNLVTEAGTLLLVPDKHLCNHAPSTQHTYG